MDSLFSSLGFFHMHQGICGIIFIRHSSKSFQLSLNAEPKALHGSRKETAGRVYRLDIEFISFVLFDKHLHQALEF